jgi:hypothetical protein
MKVICLPVITDITDSQCLPVGTDDRRAYLSYRTINYLFVQITVTCLPVCTDDRCACLSNLTINYIFVKITVTCLPVGTDDRCACLYSRIVRIRSTGNVDPVSHTLQKQENHKTVRLRGIHRNKINKVRRRLLSD